jgi:hypothetical protein
MYARDVNELLGKTLVKIVQFDNDELEFYTDKGEKYVMFHSQECCESVAIEDIIGDLNDLIGEPLLIAEKVSNHEFTAEEDKLTYGDELEGWTFYKFATIKGYVDIRWFGSSNGYYSVSVDFALIDVDKEENTLSKINRKTFLG